MKAPARVVDRTDPLRSVRSTTRAGALLRVATTSLEREVDIDGAPAVRSAPRSARGRCGGVDKAPARVVDRTDPRSGSVRSVGVGALGERREGFSASSDYQGPSIGWYTCGLVVICSSFPRSVPRAAAPGGPPEGTPHPMTSARLIVQRLFQFVANRSHARSIEQSGLEASSVN